MNAAEINRAHSAIIEAALADGETKEAATILADEFLQVIEDDVKAKLVDKERAAEAERSYYNHERLKDFFAFFWILIIVLAALAAIALFSYEMYAIAGHGNKDYAGYAPKKAADHAVDAYHSYFGDVGTPAVLHVLGQKHTVINGKAAWRMTLKGDGGVTSCVYVWSSSIYQYKEAGAGGYKVVPGTCK